MDVKSSFKIQGLGRLYKWERGYFRVNAVKKMAHIWMSLFSPFNTRLVGLNSETIMM